MAGGNMFGRALSYVLNEFLVEGLANNDEYLSSKAKEVTEELSEQLKEARGQNTSSREDESQFSLMMMTVQSF